MASVGVVDDDRSGGSVSRRLGLQKRKGQEKRAFYPKELGWGRRRTRSSKGKEKHIKDDAYYRPGIIKENLDTWDSFENAMELRRINMNTLLRCHHNEVTSKLGREHHHQYQQLWQLLNSTS